MDFAPEEHRDCAPGGIFHKEHEKAKKEGGKQKAESREKGTDE